MFRKSLWAGPLVALLALGFSSSKAHAIPIETITNGTFDTNLSGWNTTINVVQAGGVAVLSPLGVLNSTLAQTFDPKGLPEITISFDYTINSLDLPIPLGDAKADVFSVSVNGKTLPIPFGTSNDPPFGGATVQSGSFSQKFLTSDFGAGPYTIEFKLNSTASLGESTSVFVDNVSILATPEPTSIAFFGLLGLGVAYCSRRRQKS